MEHDAKHVGGDYVASSTLEEKRLDLDPALSIGEGQVDNEGASHGNLHRTLSPRMIHVISLGSSIGSGLFIATGKALAEGGPGNMFLGYLVVCLGVWANLQTLTEMTIAFPTSGNYIDYADRWVDLALAFGAGFAEWLGWTSVFASEGTFLVILVNFWAGGVVPEAALREFVPLLALWFCVFFVWIFRFYWRETGLMATYTVTIFLVICFVVFLMPTSFFGWLEYIGSLVKAFLFVFITIISLAIIGGAGPTGYVRDGSTWTELPAFKNSFGGFSNAALLAIWAVGDQVFIGVMAGEAESPRYSMAHASNLIPWRVAVFYLLSVVLVSLIVLSTDSRLLGGSSVASSPFVIAVQDAGIPGVPDLINACMIVGILAIALECIFLPSRILRTMSLQGLLPAFVAQVDKKGRPRWALAITAVAGVALTYMSLSAGGTEVLNWLIAITSASFFINWAIIAVTSFRFRAAMRAQQSPLFETPYAWQSLLWPLAPVTSLVVSSVLLVCLLYTSVKPVSGGSFTAYSFFSATIGLILIVVSTIAYKILRRTPWRVPATADLVTGRRELSTEELRMLDAYYGRPLWRRMGTYLRVW